MDYRPLGHTDIRVSELCLGTMTWGQQNTEAEAHEQLDIAVAAGVNFIDTAEMYPVPPSEEHLGLTESLLGTWLARRRDRERLVIATKISGTGRVAPNPAARPRLDRANVRAAVDASLRRLQTDYIDLYQVHWPDRHANFFGRLGFEPRADADGTPLQETLAALAEQVEAGKVRHVGVCNETPWGVMRYLALAERAGLPRILTVQNPYSLLNRSFEVGLAEIAHREGTGLMAYSPLAFGVLTGKYLDDEPANARLTLYGDRYRRYSGEPAEAATRAYVALAREHGLEPAAMALAFARTRPFTTSVILGATRPEQLRANLESAEVALPDELLADIERVHAHHPNPCP